MTQDMVTFILLKAEQGLCMKHISMWFYLEVMHGYVLCLPYSPQETFWLSVWMDACHRVFLDFTLTCGPYPNKHSIADEYLDIIKVHKKC